MMRGGGEWERAHRCARRCLAQGEFYESASHGRAIDMRCVVVVTNLPVVPVSREQALRNLVAK